MTLQKENAFFMKILDIYWKIDAMIDKHWQGTEMFPKIEFNLVILLLLLRRFDAKFTKKGLKYLSNSTK